MKEFLNRLIICFKRKVLKQYVGIHKGDYIIAKLGVDRDMQKGKVISVVIDRGVTCYVIKCLKKCNGWDISKKSSADIDMMIKWKIPKRYLGTKQEFWVVKKWDIIEIL